MYQSEVFENEKEKENENDNESENGIKIENLNMT